MLGYRGRMVHVRHTTVVDGVSCRVVGGYIMVNKIRLVDWRKRGVNVASLISGPTIALMPRGRTGRYVMRSLTNSDQLTTRPLASDDFEINSDVPQWKRRLLAKLMLKGCLVIEPNPI